MNKLFELSKDKKTLLTKYIICFVVATAIVLFIFSLKGFFGTDKKAYQKELSYLAHEYAIKEYEIRSREEKQVPILHKVITRLI